MIPFTILLTSESAHNSRLQNQVEELSRAFRSQTVDEKDLKNIGLALWEIVSKTNEFSTFSNAYALIIQSDDVTVHDLPWECLYHPEYGFLGKHPDFTLSRCLSNYQELTLKINTNPLKILHFTAQPDDLKVNARLEIEREQYFLENTLNPFIQSGQVYLHSPNDGRFSTLKSLLQETWHLVLLTGHNFLGQSSYFLFENEKGHSHAVSTEILAQIFKNQQVECLVLSACDSGKSYLNNNSLAIQCFQAGVPHLIGMRESVIDRANSVFVLAFCEAVIKKARIDVAVQRGRCAMTNLLKYNEKWRGLNTKPSEGQWSLPLLFSHAPMQVLCAEIPHNFPFSQEKIQKISKIFIGRRRELRVLTEKLGQEKIKRLLIYGKAGIGKTAFAEQLTKNLSTLSYKIIQYSPQLSNSPDFKDIFSINDWRIIRNRLQQEKWLFWFDEVQNAQSDSLLTTSTIHNLLNLPIYDNILIILSFRRTVPQIRNFYNYELAPPHFNDFCHYARYLDLPYKTLELRLIYKVLNGNFKGLQLLQTLQSVKTLKKQLIIAKRYLVAYSRES